MAGDNLRPDKQRRRAGELLAHHRPESGQDLDEALLGASRAWVARIGPRGRVLFAGRHRHLVALTDRRLVAWRHPKRADAPPAIDVPLSRLRLRAEHPGRPFFQLLAGLDTGGTESSRGRETLVIELRHRDHAFGRALGRALSATPAAAGAG
jgi:hypothetical protein